MKKDLSKLSVNELEDLQGDIQEIIKQRREEEKAEGIQKIKDIMEQYDLGWHDFPGLRTRSLNNATARKAAVRYRDPENPGNTWAGRGRKPLWLETALAAGKDLESFRV